MTGKQLRIAAALVAVAYIAIQGFQEYVFRALGEPATPAEALAIGGHPLRNTAARGARLRLRCLRGKFWQL